MQARLASRARLLSLAQGLALGSRTPSVELARSIASAHPAAATAAEPHGARPGPPTYSSARPHGWAGRGVCDEADGGRVPSPARAPPHGGDHREEAAAGVSNSEDRGDGCGRGGRSSGEGGAEEASRAVERGGAAPAAADCMETALQEALRAHRRMEAAAARLSRWPAPPDS